MRKGQSAMIAIVLLIMMAIVAGVLVTTFSQKSTSKISEKIIEIGSSVECSDIRLSLSYDGTDLTIKNRGTLGVNQVKLKIYAADIVTTDDLGSDEFDGKLLPGDIYVHESIVPFDRVEAKPIFLNEEGDLMGCDDVLL
jgi:flagellin-like protein